jgi:hypothetical protein
MEWNRSETLALAAQSCTQCHGLGLRLQGDASHPCNCVLRTIFRTCFRKFQNCATQEKHLSRVSMEGFGSNSNRKVTWGRKDEEYVADFCIVARRTLDAQEHKLFRYHFLLGADWRLCCRQLKMDRGNFFHSVYRLQAKLGRVLRELEPYALYPVEDYFGNGSVNRPIAPNPTTPANVLQMPRIPTRLRFPSPLRKVA